VSEPGQQPPPMTVADAAASLLILAEWSPPEGVGATVTMYLDADGSRMIVVTLVAVKGREFRLLIGDVADRATLEALTDFARHILQAAWDEPACAGIGPGPVRPPEGPLELRSGPHPLLDTTKMGRDL
jgi:hypothetical protein